MQTSTRKHTKTKVTLNFLRETLFKEGYVLLSDKYIDSSVHVLAICPKEHKWLFNWDSWKQGHRCKFCYYKQPRPTKHTIKNIREYVEAEGYKIFSNEYKNPQSILLLECPKNHCYSTMWQQFYRGERCRRCRFNVWDIETVRRLLKEEKYHLVSTEYKNPHTKLDSICPNGHKWNFVWSEFRKGYRCGECAKQATISKGEKKLGEILEQIFAGYQVKSQDNLGFLGRLTVDYSVRELGLAFEYDGEHHFSPITYGGMSQQTAKQQFKKQQERDCRKDSLCNQNKIRLIRIRYDEPLTVTYIKNKKIGLEQVGA